VVVADDPALLALQESLCAVVAKMPALLALHESLCVVVAVRQCATGRPLAARASAYADKEHYVK
jgi:hypothetical protein